MRKLYQVENILHPDLPAFGKSLSVPEPSLVTKLAVPTLYHIEKL